MNVFEGDVNTIVYSNYYHQYERNFHHILEYQNKSSNRREKANTLFLESLSSKNDHIY